MFVEYKRNATANVDLTEQLFPYSVRSYNTSVVLLLSSTVFYCLLLIEMFTYFHRKVHAAIQLIEDLVL